MHSSIKDCAVMNYWTQQSIDFAQQRNYLDERFKVYPLSPNLRRELSQEQEDSLRSAYTARDNVRLVETLLDAELFPVKDSYVPFLRYDRAAIARNPQTVNRIAGTLYQMGIDAVIEKCTAPKETNRQMGPLFKRWIAGDVIGVPVVNDPEEFLRREGSCILNASDGIMHDFAAEFLGFKEIKALISWPSSAGNM